ncbi:hypothetical protein Hanom_Chr11g01042351 [Helianthus anomalus]
MWRHVTSGESDIFVPCGNDFFSFFDFCWSAFEVSIKNYCGIFLESCFRLDRL